MEELTLKSVLAWVVSGGGSAAIVYFLMDNVGWLVKLPPDYKRWVSWGMAAVFSWLGWGAFLLLGYEALPATWQYVAERMFIIAATAIIAVGGVHGAIDLRRKRKALEE